MLYDPKWEQQTNPFSLTSLIAWLEKQPAGKTYCYTDGGECLIAQYLQSIGRTNVRVWCGGAYETRQGRGQVPREMWRTSIDEPSTFGAALARARALMPDTELG